MKIQGKQVARITILTLFLLFIALYATQVTGYYEFSQRKRMELTEAEVKRFEEDVKKGVEIDIRNYLNEKEKNYNNRVSDTTLSVSNGIETLFNKGLNSIFKAIDQTMNSD